jgi:hypothetical protein
MHKESPSIGDHGPGTWRIEGQREKLFEGRPHVPGAALMHAARRSRAWAPTVAGTRNRRSTPGTRGRRAPRGPATSDAAGRPAADATRSFRHRGRCAEKPAKPHQPAPSDDQDRRLPPTTSMSTATERHARASDQHVRRWRRLPELSRRGRAIRAERPPGLPLRLLWPVVDQDRTAVRWSTTSVTSSISRISSSS